MRHLSPLHLQSHDKFGAAGRLYLICECCSCLATAARLFRLRPPRASVSGHFAACHAGRREGGGGRDGTAPVLPSFGSGNHHRGFAESPGSDTRLSFWCVKLAEKWCRHRVVDGSALKIRAVNPDQRSGQIFFFFFF